MNRKIVVFFIVTVILLTFFSVSHLSAATYYVSSSVGSDSNSGTSPSYPWKSLFKVNSSSLKPGDSILFKKGDTWRETLTVPSPGSAGNPITFGAYGTGNPPIVSGATAGSSWDQTAIVGTPLPPNTWRCYYASAPTVVWFQEGSTIKQGKKRTVLNDVNAKYDWYYDAQGYLVVYSATNPGLAFGAVEGATRDKAITASAKNYITVTGLDLRYTKSYGIQNRNGSNWIIDGNVVHHIGAIGQAWPSEGIGIEAGMGSGSALSNTVSNNTIYETGRHGVDLIGTSGGACSDNIVEKNIIYNSYHTGIDLNNGGAGTNSRNIIRYNKIYADSSYGDFAIACNGVYGDANSGSVIEATEIYYNLFYNLPGKGIENGVRMTNTVIYNNTVANKNPLDAGWREGIKISNTGVEGVIVKNNIVYGYDSAFYVGASAGISAVDYNLWYSSGIAPYVQVDGVSYRSGHQAAYKLATGYDTNGKWENPRFVSASDFHLQSTSRCIDAGTDVSLPTDYDGNVVPVGGAPDIGAYEYNPDGRGPKPPTGIHILK